MGAVCFDGENGEEANFSEERLIILLSRNNKWRVDYMSLGFQREITARIADLETSIHGWYLNQEIGGLPQTLCRGRREKPRTESFTMERLSRKRRI